MLHHAKQKPRPPILVKESVFRSKVEKYITHALVFVGFLIVAVFAKWWFTNKHIPQNFSGTWHLLDYTFFVLLSYVVWHQILNELLSWEVALWMRKPRHMSAKPGMRVALLTAFVPGDRMSVV